MKKRSLKSICWLLIVAIFTSQCQMYHIREVNNDDFLRNPRNTQKLSYHLIVHVGNNMVEMVNPMMTENGLTGNTIPVSIQLASLYQYALNKPNFKANKQNRPYLNQLHLFVSEAQSTDTKITLSYGDLEKVQILDKNIGLTTLSTIAITAPSLFIAFVGFLMIACNCPHAYVLNGNTWEYTNTLFTGAVHPELERYDIKHLADYRPESHSFLLQLKNEEDETQYTNELKLVAVYHPKGAKVVADQSGNYFAVQHSQAPYHVKNDEEEIASNLIAFDDDETFKFETSDKSDFSHLYASFKTKDMSNKSHLIIRAKNNSWGAYVYHKFAELFGEKYDNWVSNNSSKNKAQLDKSLNKTGILMDVEVYHNKRWKKIDQLQLVGEKGFNNIAVKVPEEFLNDETLQIRLKAGFRFWEVDQVVLAETDSQGLEVEEYSAVATNDAFLNAGDQIATDDDSYFIHQKGDAPLSLSFEGLKALPRTLFLKSKGYYRNHKSFEGKPDYLTLLGINRKGGLSAFSRAQFQEMMVLNRYFAEIPKN